MTLDPGPVSDQPQTLLQLDAYLAPLRAHLIETVPGTREAALRTNSRRRELTAFQAYLFGRAYGSLFGIRDTLKIQIIEKADYDALVTWTNAGKPQQLRLQLKEVVSPKWNRKAGPAEDELANVLNPLPTKYPNATDLTVGVFANYGANYMKAAPPPNLRLAGLWIFGFADEARSHLFIAGGKQGEHRWFEPPWNVRRPAA